MTRMETARNLRQPMPAGTLITHPDIKGMNKGEKVKRDIMHVTMKNRIRRLLSRLFRILKVSAVTSVVMFALLTAALRILNLKVGIDLQENVCLGRIFLYRDTFYPPGEFFERKIRGAHPVAVRLLKDVRIFKKGTVLLKRFFAGPGDRIVRSGGSLTALRKISSVPNENVSISAVTVMKDSAYSQRFSPPEITDLNEREYYFVGDSPLSLDSRILGPFRAEDTELAEVLFML